jgi:dynein heavy chain
LDGGFNILQVVATEKEWKYWCDTESPEEEDIPCGYHQTLDVFRKLLLIRSWCPDRTLSQVMIQLMNRRQGR